MNSQKYLLIKPIPFPGESPGGLILRASFKNGWEKPSTFFDSIFFNKNTYFANLLIDKKKWGEVKKKLLCTEDRYDYIDYRKISKSKNSDINMQGLIITQKNQSLIDPKLCSLCLKNQGYLKSIWDMRLINQCLDHHILLIDSCPNCDEKLKWNRPSISQCHNCGFNLTKGKPIIANKETSIYLKKILKDKDSDKLNLLTNRYRALYKMYSFVNEDISNARLSEISILCTINSENFINILTVFSSTIIEKSHLHPRILFVYLMEEKQDIELQQALQIIYKNLQYNSFSAHPKTIKGGKLITKYEGCIILGISNKLLRQLIYEQLLDVIFIKSKNKKQNGTEYLKLKSLNNLLFMFSVGKRKIDSNQYAYSDGCIKEKFSNLVKNLMRENPKSRGRINLAKGLTSIPTYKNTFDEKKEEKYKNESEFISLKEAASLLKCRSDYLQNLAKVGFIKTKRGRQNKHLVKQKEIIRFKKDYCFIGDLAKKYDANPTNLSEKLIHFGCQPVSGPNINGSLVCLFSKEDLKKNSVTKHRLQQLKKYKTKAGRKKDTSKTSTDKELVKLIYIREQLGFNVQQINSLIKSGVLVESNIAQRNTYVTAKSFNKLLNIITDKNLIKVKDACKLTKERKSQFLTKWINSNFVKHIDICIEKYVHKKDLQKILHFKEGNITIKEASEATLIPISTYRSAFIAGKLKPSQMLIGNKKFYYFKKAEILKIKPIEDYQTS